MEKYAICIYDSEGVDVTYAKQVMQMECFFGGLHSMLVDDYIGVKDSGLLVRRRVAVCRLGFPAG